MPHVRLFRTPVADGSHRGTELLGLGYGPSTLARHPHRAHLPSLTGVLVLACGTFLACDWRDVADGVALFLNVAWIAILMVTLGVFWGEKYEKWLVKVEKEGKKGKNGPK